MTKQIIIITAMLLIMVGCQNKTPTPPKQQIQIVKKDLTAYKVTITDGRFVNNKKIYWMKKTTAIVPEKENIAIELKMKRKGRYKTKDASIYVDNNFAMIDFLDDSYYSQSKNLTYYNEKNWQGEKNYFKLNKILSSKDAASNVKVYIEKL